MSQQRSGGAPSAINFGAIIGNFRLFWRLLNDQRVPQVLKIALPVMIALYLISPIDFIPDFIPVLGQADDVAVLLFGIQLFINLCPRAIVDEHRAALGLSDQTSVLPPAKQQPVDYRPQPQPQRENVDAQTTRLGR